MNDNKSPRDCAEDLVEYTAPLDDSRGDQSDIFAAVNGESVRIRRGDTVRLKHKFARVLDDARRQDRAAMEAMRRLAR